MISRRAAALRPSIIREMSGRRRDTSIDLSLGQPALPPNQGVQERAFRALTSGAQGYTATAGLPALRDAIADYHGLEGRTSAENVVVTVGSEEAVFAAMMTCLDPGDEVLVPEPGYPAYTAIATLIGAVPVPYLVSRASGLVPTASEILAKVTYGTKAIVLNGPSNPFGQIDSADELAQIAGVVEANGLTVISDEIYRELHYGPSPPPSIAAMTKRSIFVSGLSKSCATTGLRLGYLIASEETARQATFVHQLMVTCAPRLAQLVGLEIFREPELLSEHLPYYAKARQAVLHEGVRLPGGAELIVGGGAFYAVIDVSAFAGGDPYKLAVELFDAEDVIVVPGVAFGASGDWFWRLSYAAGGDTTAEGLRRIARFLADQ